MPKSLFSSVSVLALSLLGAAALPAAEPTAAILDIRKNSAGTETQTHGIVLSAHPSLVITVASAVEEKDSFTSRHAASETKAAVGLFDSSSRILVLKPEAAPSGEASRPAAGAPAAGSKLRWLNSAGPQPAMDAGPIKQLDGRALALTLRRVHFGSSDPDLAPIPGTPVFNDAGEVTALALSSFSEDPGAWLCLPIAAAAKLADDYAATGHAETGRLDLGIAVGTTTPRVEFVKAGSRAEKAGLQAGDILLELNGRPLADVFDVLDANFYLTTRNPVPIRLLRGLDTLILTAPAVPPAAKE